jgi:hypothetical protein
MTRIMKTLGIGLVAVFALSAVASSMASAKDLGSHAGLFTAGVGAGVTANIDTEPIGVGDTFTFVSGVKITCAAIQAQGKAILAGPSSTYIKLTPIYEKCHVVVGGLTKTITITHNECQYTYNLTTTTESTPSGLSFEPTADLAIICPQGKQIEIHMYKEKEKEVTSECTHTIKEQTLNHIPLTNIIGSPNAVVAHINLAVAIQNDILNGMCGQSASATLTYKGQETIRATDPGTGNFVSTSISD